MRTIYVILIFLVMFNFMLVFTSASGIFPGEDMLYEGESITNVSGVDLTNISEGDILTILFGFSGGSVTAIVASIFTLGVAAIAAYVFRSPVPLGIGVFLSVFIGLWIVTYSTLTKFNINNTLLLAGTVGIGILFVINVVEMALQQPTN